jgi:hypothetical protein
MPAPKKKRQKKTLPKKASKDQIRKYLGRCIASFPILNMTKIKPSSDRLSKLSYLSSSLPTGKLLFFLSSLVFPLEDSSDVT